MDLTESTKNFKPLVSMYLKLYLKSIDLNLRHLKFKSKSKFKFPNTTLIFLTCVGLFSIDGWWFDVAFHDRVDFLFFWMLLLLLFLCHQNFHLIASTSLAYGLVLIFLNAASTIFYDSLWLQKWWMNLCVLLCVDVRDFILYIIIGTEEVLYNWFFFKNY